MRRFDRRRWLFLILVIGWLGLQRLSGAELRPQTIASWETYIQLTEQRIATELKDGQKFLVSDFLKDSESRSVRSRLRSGQLPIQKLKTFNKDGREIPVRDGMIHHWIGSVFVPGASLDSLLFWIQDYDQHERYFQEIDDSRLISRDSSTFRIFFRIQRKKIITVHYNTEHMVLYHRHDAKRASSRSFTTRIAQLDDPGTPQEKEKPVGNDSGFLWRLNSYWRFQQADGGVFVECESISLSREIPFGLGWMIKGYVESVPRESLENTLASIRENTRNRGQSQTAGRL